jgi:HAE1 family hydrophobic/amphiphilic exporter-1
MGSFFVRRPIVAMVISIITVLVGVVSLARLPIAQLPDIAPPMIMIQGNYDGADALTVEQSVATPLEQKVNGVEGMIYMQSTNSSDGKMALNASFEVGRDIDIANVLTQTRVNEATPVLPASVKQSGISLKKSLSMPMIVVSTRQTARSIRRSWATTPSSTSTTSSRAFRVSVASTWWAARITRCACG